MTHLVNNQTEKHLQLSPQSCFHKVKGEHVFALFELGNLPFPPRLVLLLSTPQLWKANYQIQRPASGRHFHKRGLLNSQLQVCPAAPSPKAGSYRKQELSGVAATLHCKPLPLSVRALASQI